MPPALFRDLLVEAGVARAEDIVITRDLMNLEPAHEGLRAYFKPWHLIRRLPLTAESLQSIVRAAVAHLRDDNIVYAELRHSVVHVAVQNGFTVHETLRLILDALEQASDTHDIDARLIVSLVRHEFLRECTQDLLDALRGERDNLGVTIHAGETGRAENIRWAIETCGATRIGHGLAASQDREVLELIREHAI